MSLTNNNPNPSYAASNSGLVMGGRLFSNLRLKKAGASKAVEAERSSGQSQGVFRWI
ncbi:MAG: hypothetical protein IPK94_05070 [Saprospiraceae bacterium]|nr:hypothetical protein [Saprospiraceae bacterium]